MGKFSILASLDSIPKLIENIETEFKTKTYASCNLDVMKRSAEEIVLAIAKIDKDCNPITIDINIKPSGTDAQFLHAGPIFNPCSSEDNHCPFTTSQMDEISFEFKYGHSVVAVFKKIPVQNT